MASSYVRPKFTDAEARALMTMGRYMLNDEYLAAEIFSTGVETSSAWAACRKLFEAIANENPKVKTDKTTKKAKK